MAIGPGAPFSGTVCPAERGVQNSGDDKAERLSFKAHRPRLLFAALSALWALERRVFPTLKPSRSSDSNADLLDIGRQASLSLAFYLSFLDKSDETPVAVNNCYGANTVPLHHIVGVVDAFILFYE